MRYVTNVTNATMRTMSHGHFWLVTLITRHLWSNCVPVQVLSKSNPSLAVSVIVCRTHVSLMVSSIWLISVDPISEDTTHHFWCFFMSICPLISTTLNFMFCWQFWIPPNRPYIVGLLHIVHSFVCWFVTVCPFHSSSFIFLSFKFLRSFRFLSLEALAHASGLNRGHTALASVAAPWTLAHRIHNTSVSVCVSHWSYKSETLRHSRTATWFMIIHGFTWPCLRVRNQKLKLKRLSTDLVWYDFSFARSNELLAVSLNFNPAVSLTSSEQRFKDRTCTSLVRLPLLSSPN